MKVNNKMNMSNSFISFVLVLILGNQTICMEQDFKRQRKDEGDENKELVMQPLTLKMSCLNIYKTLNPPSDALSWALGFLAAPGYSSDLKVDILCAWNPENIEAASEVLFDHLTKDIFCYNSDPKGEKTDQDINFASSQDIKFASLLIKKLPLECIEKLVGNEDFFNHLINLPPSLRAVLFEKVSNKVINTLFSFPVIPHSIKCALFVGRPTLQKMGIARQLLAADIVTKEVIEVIGSLVYNDMSLINLLLTTVPLVDSNELLLRNYFLDEYKKGLERYTFYAQAELLNSVENNSVNKPMVNPYKVKWNGEEIIVYQEEQEGIINSYSLNLIPIYAIREGIAEELNKIPKLFLFQSQGYIDGHCVLLPEKNQLITIFNNPNTSSKIKYIAIFDLNRKKCISSYVLQESSEAGDFSANIQDIFFSEQTKKIIITLENSFCYSVQLPIFLCDDFNVKNAGLQLYFLSNSLFGFVNEVIMKQYIISVDPNSSANRFINENKKHIEECKKVIASEDKEQCLAYCNVICQTMGYVTKKEAKDMFKVLIRHYLSCNSLTAFQSSSLQRYRLELKIIKSYLEE